MQLAVNEALSALKIHKDQTFLQLFRHGTMSVEIYRPHEVDLQQPHLQDEVYVIISGTGNFQNGDKTHTFGPGDLLFVPAGVPHRFIDFTEDFCTWVIFYGAAGGEANGE